jgi:murein L,D-transpeptidase YafK
MGRVSLLHRFLTLCTVAFAVASLSPAVAKAPASKEAAEHDPVVAPAAGDLNQRLAEKGMSAGSPIMIRIFKFESELELWMQKEGRFELFNIYRICNWSGGLGPKLHEGDRQSPEGLYSVGQKQIHRRGRWPRSLNLGFPNALDRSYARTGSLILVHGGCTSTGCYAMTSPVMEEIYGLAEQALNQGQDRFQVHVFPFRMTNGALDAYRDNVWHAFWANLKEAYDIFERTRIPPSVSVCNRRYVVAEGLPAAEAEPAACIEADLPQIAATESKPHAKAKTPRARRVASKTHYVRSAGRNARKAYASARRARILAHARRTRATAMANSKRAH